VREAIASAIALASLLGCPAREQPAAVDDPCGIERLKDDWIATPALHACADRGDARAQAYLGMIYWTESDSRYPDREGNGVDPNLTNDQLRAEGRRLMEIAVLAGSREAQNELGLAHLEGRYGVPKDAHRALALLTAADGQDDSLASYNLARMHYAGMGVTKSELQAQAFLWRSASLGYQPALCTLALLREKEGADATARAFRLAARAMDVDFFACSFDHSDISDEFR
jgi:TPR repeat protein